MQTELNTALAEDVLSSVAPEVRLPDLADEIEAEDCYHEHQRALERGNVCVKERIRCSARLGRYLDELLAGRDRGSRSETFGRFSGSERVLPEWATKQQKYRWSQIGKIDDELRERYFNETEAADDEVTTAGLLDYWTQYLEEQEDSTDDDEDTDDEETDDNQDDEDTNDDYPTQKTLTLPMSVGEGRTFDANRAHLRDVVLAELRRLMAEGK